MRTLASLKALEGARVLLLHAGRGRRPPVHGERGRVAHQPVARPPVRRAEDGQGDLGEEGHRQVPRGHYPVRRRGQRAPADARRQRGADAVRGEPQGVQGVGEVESLWQHLGAPRTGGRPAVPARRQGTHVLRAEVALVRGSSNG